MVRHAIDYLTRILEVDRRTNQGMEAFDRSWPVTVSVPLTPTEYDSLRFLSSLYPANPSEIARAALLPYLDAGSRPPGRLDDGMDMERTARVSIGLDEDEAERLEGLAGHEGVAPERVVLWALWGSLGPLMDVPRP